MIDYTLTYSGVYKLTCTKTKKIYVGSSSNIGHRWWKHFNDVERNNCKKLANAIKKHGVDNFVAEVLEVVQCNNRCELRRVLIEREQHYLDTLLPFDNIGYNIVRSAGSNLGHKHTDEQKKRWSEAKKGNKNPMWGRTHTEETRQKIGEAGRGKTRSKDQRAKMGRHRARQILAIDPTTHVVVFEYASQAEAVQHLKADPTALWKCLKKHKHFKTHKGYIWKYKN